MLLVVLDLETLRRGVVCFYLKNRRCSFYCCGFANVLNYVTAAMYQKYQGVITPHSRANYLRDHRDN